MRKYLDSSKLAKRIRETLAQLGKTQNDVAGAVNATQGEVSNVLAGRFKTENQLVSRICKYAKIQTSDYLAAAPKSKPPADAVAALVHACRGSRIRTQTVVRILRALEGLR